LAGGGEVYARVAEGPPGAPTIVLLHGWTATATLNWFQVLDRLAACYRVVAVDLAGHGGGVRGARRRPRHGLLDASADDVVGLLAALGIDEPVVVVGYSLGGAVAQVLWRRHPERVRGLVLCASAACYNPRAGEWTPFSWLRLGAAFARPLPAWVAGGIAEIVFLVRYGRTDFDRWVRREVATHDWRDVLALGAALGGFDSRAWAARIDVPVAVVATVRDRSVPLPDQIELAEVTSASVHPVDGDHAACLHDVDCFAPALLDACATVTGSAGPGRGEVDQAQDRSEARR
jgi:3-oxoadipate enol-lactonase